MGVCVCVCVCVLVLFGRNQYNLYIEKKQMRANVIRPAVVYFRIFRIC